MGVGLPIEWAWPSLIEKSRPYPMLNLGLGGGTTDTVARILTNITGLFQIDTVFILWPAYLRFEIYKDKTVDFVIPNNSQLAHTWNMDSDISQQRFYKNKLIVDLLGHNTISQTIDSNSDNIFNGLQFLDGFDLVSDRARDGMHFGAKTHELIAKIFLEKLTNIE